MKNSKTYKQRNKIEPKKPDIKIPKKMQRRVSLQRINRKINHIDFTNKKDFELVSESEEVPAHRNTDFTIVRDEFEMNKLKSLVFLE